MREREREQGGGGARGVGAHSLPKMFTKCAEMFTNCPKMFAKVYTNCAIDVAFVTDHTTR